MLRAVDVPRFDDSVVGAVARAGQGKPVTLAQITEEMTVPGWRVKQKPKGCVERTGAVKAVAGGRSTLVMRLAYAFRRWYA